MKERHPKYITVTIPAYKEPDILRTLESLLACDRSGINLQIAILINASNEEQEEVKQVNSKAFVEVKTFIESNDLQSLVGVEYVEFDSKTAGVGLARKTLMDQAAQAFKSQGINGVILALDADCTVDPSYLRVVSDYFMKYSYEAASLHFEHPVGENSIEIIEYEWHLRYFINLQKWSAFPFAIHTVGSSMCCLSETYIAKGGMNKRKAGEDFYFMHKFIKDRVCGEIKNTTVYPSGRISDRVPFGTGRAIGKYKMEDYVAHTYSPRSFEVLREWNANLLQRYDELPTNETKSKTLSQFLTKIDFANQVESIKRNVKNMSAFEKRYYQFFDAFKLMKCLHHMRSEFPDITIEKSMKWYCENILREVYTTKHNALMRMREVDRLGD